MERRKSLIERMDLLESEGKNCLNCTGICCTFRSNSMQITAIETEDIYLYLKKNKLLTDSLKARLKECILEFRLDKDISTGKSSFRRSYTCPFFQYNGFGCALPKKIKPYGCLAFNSKSSDVKDGENCGSDKILLEERESIEESLENDFLKKKFNYYWDKLPIPMAILEREERA